MVSMKIEATKYYGKKARQDNKHIIRIGLKIESEELSCIQKKTIANIMPDGTKITRNTGAAGPQA
jgi:hypothetical protein